MKIRVHPSFIIYLSFIAMLSSLTVCICVAASLAIHELCHYAACKVIGEEIEQLELTPLGGVMTYKREATSSKGLKGVYIHAAGPVGNYAALLISSMALSSGLWNAEFLRSMIIANASIMLINLLPALPLDGGQILFCLGYYVFPVAKLVRFLACMGSVIGLTGVLFALYGLVSHGLLNCSLLIVGIHMLIHSGKSGHALLAENIYTVVHERLAEQQKLRKIVFYETPPNEPLFGLISYLRQNRSVCFVFSDMNSLCELHEAAFCQALLSMPHATIRMAYRNAQQYQEKVRKNTENV